MIEKISRGGSWRRSAEEGSWKWLLDHERPCSFMHARMDDRLDVCCRRLVVVRKPVLVDKHVNLWFVCLSFRWNNELKSACDSWPCSVSWFAYWIWHLNCLLMLCHYVVWVYFGQVQFLVETWASSNLINHSIFAWNSEPEIQNRPKVQFDHNSDSKIKTTGHGPFAMLIVGCHWWSSFTTKLCDSSYS